MKDISGKPPSNTDLDEAIAAVKHAIIRDIVKIPPSLAIQLTNILRCLQHLKEIT